MMEKLILLLLKKYHSNWDVIYETIKNKEQVDWSEVNSYKPKLECDYLPIISNNYPDKLKTIYMPPFALFYDGNIKLIDKYVISIVGKLSKSEVDNLIKSINNDVLCISDLHLSKYLFDKIQELKIKTIIVCSRSIFNCKFYQREAKMHNVLWISEHYSANIIPSDNQNHERLIFAFADKIIVTKNAKKEDLYLYNNINKVNFNNPKTFYCLTILEKELSDNFIVIDNIVDIL